MPPLVHDASTPMGRFSRLREVGSLDRAFVFPVLAGRWSSAAGAGTLILIVHFLAEQGSYYNISSLLAFERGLSFDVLKRGIHERAHITISTSGEKNRRSSSPSKTPIGSTEVWSLVLRRRTTALRLASRPRSFFLAHAQRGQDSSFCRCAKRQKACLGCSLLQIHSQELRTEDLLRL